MVLNLKRNKNILVLFLTFLILWIVFGYFFTKSRIDDLSHQKFQEITSLMTNKLETLIDEKQETILIIAMSISKNENIKKLLSDNPKNLNLDKFSSSLRKNTSLKNIWFQVISSDGRSLYRSWTKKAGDDLSKARLDVAQMIKNPKITSSISTGKFDLSFKSMVPIYNNGKFIAFIEVIAKFNSVAIKMQKEGYQVVMLVDKKYKKQLTHAFTKTFVDDYYVANLNAKTEPLSLVKNKTVSHFLETNEFHKCENTTRLVETYHLKDVKNKEMGYFLLFKNIKDINMSDIEQVQERLILFFFLIFIFLVAILYYIYTNKYTNFIQNLNKQLEDEITNKTQKLQNQSDKLEYVANHDSLTKLPNRMLFLDRFKQSIKHAQRNKSSVSILFLDLDRFKEVNDTYGHHIGDVLLQDISKKLRENIREADTVSRLGGDEFTIILEDVNTNDIIQIANKIISIMQEKTTIDSIEIYTTFSIGISRYPEDGDNPEILLRNADTAMYKAKEMGKNQYQFYNQVMTKKAIEKAKIEKEIRLALQRNEFEPYFQPKIDAVEEEVIGMESLVRWNHPTLGVLAPDKFLAVAEETNLLVEIDKLMMQKSLEKLKLWIDKDICTGKMSFNLSVQQLEKEECYETIKTNLQKYNVPAKYLEVEVTESQIMRNPEASIKILTKIRKLGISISVDDFGTGYSSLSYLKLLPIDTLKIDRSFIIDLPSDTNDVAIVKAILSLAKSLKLDVIAEGVETQEQLDFLIFRGCYDIQGYFYSKPLCAQDFEEFLIKYQ